MSLLDYCCIFFSFLYRHSSLLTGSQYWNPQTTPWKSQTRRQTIKHREPPPPPPPIFVNDVIDIQTMIKSLERDISKEDYNLKITNNKVKILPTNPEAYRKLTKILRALKANFHTYQLKEERTFRVVLRNIHHSADIEELKTELSKLGHEVINVSNIRHRVTKDPLSLFFIDLKQKPNNKEIYNTSRLMNAIVKFEPPQIKKEIVQCKRCQRYGHTQKTDSSGVLSCIHFWRKMT